MPRVVAIVQARMGSTRLPGKTLVDIEGKPLLQHVLERLARSRRITEVVVATSQAAQDRAILEFASRLGIGAVAGSEDDVLSRYLLAARTFHADVVVRVTGDCPVIDPGLSDDVVDAFFREQADYASNWLVRTFPRGADTEAFSVESLEKVHREARQPFEREHATPYYYGHPEIFRMASVEADGELRRPDLRLCVDTEEDLRLIREVFSRLSPENPTFTIRDVIRLVTAEPGLAAINADIEQKKFQ